MSANLSHPAALPILFFTEMWERLGFYIVQGLLVLYMTEFFGFSDNDSYTISGIFAGLVYIAPFIGGFLADRFLGFKNSIVWGGLLLSAGYAWLAFADNSFFFYLALATIIVGNGLFKPNISSMLGLQYSPQDPRRDAGFTIFYIGINLGSALSGLSGYIKNAYGWKITFLLASIGMLIGFVTFLAGWKKINETKKNTSGFYWLFPISCLLAIIGISFIFTIEILSQWLMPIAGFLLLIFLISLTFQQIDLQRKQMIILTILIVSSVIFWMLFLQIFISANLFVDRLVEKQLFHVPLTTTVFYASEGLFIILLGPFFAWWWQHLGRNDSNPSPVSKFIMGIAFAGLGFLTLYWSTFYPNAAGMIPAGWVFAAYFLITIGELMLSPIGLSAVTLLAPVHLTGMMMGIWFAAIGFGGLFAGSLAKIASIPDSVTATADKLIIYQQAFLDYASIAFLVAIILFFVQMGLIRLLRQSRL